MLHPPLQATCGQTANKQRRHDHVAISEADRMAVLLVIDDERLIELYKEVGNFVEYHECLLFSL